MSYIMEVNQTLVRLKESILQKKPLKTELTGLPEMMRANRNFSKKF